MPDFVMGKGTNLVAEPGREKEFALAKFLPYVSAVNNKMIMTRDGDLISAFIAEGINADTSQENSINDLNDVLSRMIAIQGPDIGYYIHRISYEVKPDCQTEGRNAYADEINARWQSHLRSCRLRERMNIITITSRPKKMSGYMNKIFGGNQTDRMEDLQKRAKKLEQITSTLITSLADAKTERLTLSSGRWLGLLSCLVDGQYKPVKPGVKIVPLADLVSQSTIRFDQDVFSVFCSESDQTRYGSTFTIKDYPNTTYPGIFDILNLPYDTVLTQSFTPIDNLNAQEKISRIKRQMKSTEDAAVTLRMQLEQAEDDVASRRSMFGTHQASLSVFCESETELEDAVSLITRAVQETGSSLVRENLASRASFFAHHPGNYAFRTRPAMISSINFVELAAIHGSPPGRPTNKSPWGRAITVLPNARGEPYRFNFHLAGEYDERTVGHSLILGQTGSGKTLGTAFLVTQAVSLGARVIVFDKDRGFEMALRALDGDYSAVSMGLDTGFNPFRAEADQRGLAWLTDWTQMLAESTGEKLNSLQIEALTAAVDSNTQADPILQNFADFRSQLRSTDDDGSLHTAFSRWDEDGQFGWLFGGKEDDPLVFDNPVVGFDLTEVFDNDIVRTAWLSYVFRRIERLVEDEKPTLLILDEAWKLLDDPYFQLRLKDWMLTMRKKNVAVVLLTQRVSHINDSAAGNSILESAVTRLIYPSSFNTDKELAPLNLTQNENSFLKMSNVGNRFVLLKSGEDSVVLNFDLSPLGGLLGVLGGGRGVKAEENWREDPEFWKEFL